MKNKKKRSYKEIRVPRRSASNEELQIYKNALKHSTLVCFNNSFYNSCKQFLQDKGHLTPKQVDSLYKTIDSNFYIDFDYLGD